MRAPLLRTGAFVAAFTVAAALTAGLAGTAGSRRGAGAVDQPVHVAAAALWAGALPAVLRTEGDRSPTSTSGRTGGTGRLLLFAAALCTLAVVMPHASTRLKRHRAAAGPPSLRRHGGGGRRAPPLLSVCAPVFA